jgi:hypothetical protein
MAVPVEISPVVSPGRPRMLFELSRVRDFDVAPDGGHFVVIQEAEEFPPVTELNVVLNWFDELGRLAPTGGVR